MILRQNTFFKGNNNHYIANAVKQDGIFVFLI